MGGIGSPANVEFWTGLLISNILSCNLQANAKSRVMVGHMIVQFYRFNATPILSIDIDNEDQKWLTCSKFIVCMHVSDVLAQA